MTAKNIKSKSVPGDVYFTPRWAIDQILVARYGVSDAMAPSILDPGAGEGAFSKACRAQWPNSMITAIDIDKRFGPWPDANISLVGRDFLRLPEHFKFNLVIGNPPFTYALQFAKKALRIGTTVILLLRQGFLSSARRYPFWCEHPPQAVYILTSRPKFLVGKSGDTADYCWVVWEGNPGTTRVEWLPPHGREEL